MAKSYKDVTGKKEFTYIVCPCCARNRILDTEKKGRLRWDFFDPSTSPVVQIREVIGRVGGDKKAAGFHKREQLIWEQMQSNPEYADQIAAIKAQIARIAKMLE